MILRFIEIYKTAIKALLRHKARTILTMLGVIIGVFAVVSLVSVGIGMQNYMKDQFEALGSNVVFVAPGRINFADDPAKSFSNNKLEQKHVDLIESYAADYVEIVTPSIRAGKTVEFKNKKFYGTLIGGSHQAIDIFNIQLKNGRYFSKTEEKNKSSVAVLGPLVVEELFPNINPVGQRVRIEDKVYEIIGTTEKKGQDFDDNIYIPYTRVKEDFNIANFSGIAIKAKNTEEVDQTIKEVKFALLRDLKEDDFSVISTEDVLETIQNVLRLLTLVIGAIAGISLIVGGVGIMNIMLVSVTERIREIGLRKALGATSFDIGLQFIMESIMLSFGGGLIGLFFGWLASLAGRAFVRTEVPWWTALLAFGFSVLVGVVFGTYPAITASKKSPIEALRYE